jgi:hypothetical protein
MGRCRQHVASAAMQRHTAGSHTLKAMSDLAPPAACAQVANGRVQRAEQNSWVEVTVGLLGDVVSVAQLASVPCSRRCHAWAWVFVSQSGLSSCLSWSMQ